MGYLQTVEAGIEIMSSRIRIQRHQVWALVFVTALSLPCIGQVNGQPVGGAECGVYAMAAAAGALQVEFDVDLIEEGRFVGANGSSAGQLRQLALELGLWANAFQGVSIEYVRQSDTPMLLNLRRNMVGDEAGHWVTYLGDQNGTAIIFDNIAFNTTRSVSYGELCLMMTGEVVVVALEPPTRFTSMRQVCLSSFLTWIWAIPGLLMLFCIPAKGLCREFLLVLISGSIAGITASQFSVAGYGRNANAVAYVRSTRCEEIFPEVSYRQLIVMLENPDIAIVDARPKSLYETGSVEGSINFPIDSRPDGLQSVFDEIGPKRAVFVYCSGPRCDWDLAIACRLRAAGLVDIRIYEEGISTFESRKNSAIQEAL